MPVKDERSDDPPYQWEDFADALRPLERQMIEALPARLGNDPRIRQRTCRMLLMATARTALDALVGHREQPMFVPEINLAINLYQPNADTIYKSALIEPGGSYRLSGQRGSVLYAIIGQLGPDMIRTGQPSAPLSYLDLDTLTLDAAGNFSVLVSPRKPAACGGDWWRLDPAAEKLMLRQVSYDWAAEQDPAIAIERLDTAAAKAPLSAGYMSAALAELPGMIANASSFFIGHVQAMRDAGYINKLKVYDVSQMTGLSGQSYYEGAYELAHDEALIVAAPLPESCRYWSLILTNDLYETTDWYNHHSSLNGAQAAVDKDHWFRAVVCADDPGVHNWLDTAGFSSGAIQGRWMDSSATPIPEVTLVKFDQVMEYLPPETPTVSLAQREAMIRERRRALQLRRLW